MNKKKILTSALLIMLPFVLTACSLKDLPVIGKYLPDIKFPGKGTGSTTTDFPKGDVTLNVWGLWENTEVIDALIKKYQVAHPNVKVVYEDRSIIKLTDYKDSVYTRLTQNGSNVADVIFVHDSWVMSLKDNLYPAPSKVINAESFTQKFYSPAVQAAVSGGNVYALPLSYDGLVLVYNKKHFTEVNQSQPPTSWEEFRRLALELTVRGADGNLVRGGAAIGTFKNIDFASDILGLMFSQAKISVPADLASKPAYDALTFYTNFALQDKVWNDSLPEASAAFAQEKASMIMIPAWNLLDILEARTDWALSGNIGVAPVPQAVLEEPVNWSTFWMGAVPARSTNKEVAWDFLNFITQDEQQKLWFTEASKYRPYGFAYSTKSLKGELDKDAYLAPLLGEAEKSKTGILAARAGNKGAGEAIGKALNDMLYVGGTTAEIALKEAKDKLLNVR